MRKLVIIHKKLKQSRREMGYVSTNEVKAGMKIEIEKEPYTVISNEFVKPGKGQAFNRIRVKNMLTGRVVEKTFKSGEKFEIADVVESKMRMLYQEPDGVVFMDDQSFEQASIAFNIIGDTKQWLLEDQIYDVIFYKGVPIEVTPPTFMELKVTETDPGARGDTSGRVLKAAVLETGAKIQIPIFINQDDKIKIDTRTGQYVSRA